MTRSNRADAVISNNVIKYENSSEKHEEKKFVN